MPTPLRVNIYDGDETALQSSNVPLTDVIDDADERADVADELRRTGRAWIGGGAAQLFLLVLHR